MRATDGTSKKTSYRITVRQLESVIRLSEALAKVHADNRVRKEYVEEACRLLSKSIITIKKEGVELAEETQAGFDKIQAERQQEREARTDMQVDGEPVKKTTKMSYEEYDFIGKKLVGIVKAKQSEEGEMEVKQHELIEKFLRGQEHSLTSVQQLEEETQKLNNVINRLISRENVFVVIDDHENRADRTLALNINIDTSQI